MAFNLSPILNGQLFDSNGLLLVDGTIETYLAGSSTPTVTFKNSAGSATHPTTILIDTSGRASEALIYLQSGIAYKFILKDGLGNVIGNPMDNIVGINDNTLTVDQWQTSGLTPTYVSATSFTLVGDQTSAFHVGRRIKSSVTAGTAYSTITASVFTTLTTITVVNDSTVLDSGLSAVSYGILTADNPSVPVLKDSDFKVSGSANKNKILSFEVDGWAGSANRTATWPDKSGTVAMTSDISNPLSRTLNNIGLSVTPNTPANSVTIALKGADGNDPSATNIATTGFRNATITNGQSSLVSTTSALSTVISSGSTGGTVSGIASRIWVAAILVSGAVELAWFNSVSGTTIAPIFEDGLISTTAEGGAGGADSAQVWYSTTARSNVPFTILGYFDSTQTTAGTWAQTLTSLVVNPVNRPNDVLQKQYIAKTDTQTNTGTYADISGLSLSLTPRSAANKVMMTGSICVGMASGGVALIKGVRDSTDLAIATSTGSRTPCSIAVDIAGSGNMASAPLVIMDSPNSTSALTYKVQFQAAGGASNSYINRSHTDTDSSAFMRGASTLVVEEIFV